MKLKFEGWVVGTLAVALAMLVVGCIIRDDDGDRLALCSSYPDDVEKCWQPWDGHLVQTCVDSGTVATRLYFDRPEVPDSARINVMELGNVPIGGLGVLGPHYDTMVVCDRGMCRHLSVTMTVHKWVPPNNLGPPFLEFRDSADMRADRGPVRIDSLREDSCP